jgi:hypothetical protein
MIQNIILDILAVVRRIEISYVPGASHRKSCGPIFTDAFTMTPLRWHYTDVACFGAACPETLFVAHPQSPK